MLNYENLIEIWLQISDIITGINWDFVVYKFRFDIQKEFWKKLEKHGRDIIVLHCTEYSVGELLNVYLTLVLFISKDRMHVGL